MNCPDELGIERVAPDSPLAPTVSAWTYATWGHLSPDMDHHAWLAETRANAGPAGVPSVFVALLGPHPVGTASLVVQDMTIRAALTPWLASVYVCPHARGRGIASALVRRIEREASNAGLSRLYLYTPDQQQLYTRLGWQTREALTYRGENVTVMARQL